MSANNELQYLKWLLGHQGRVLTLLDGLDEGKEEGSPPKPSDSARAPPPSQREGTIDGPYEVCHPHQNIKD